MGKLSMGPSNGCWVELFTSRRFRGRCHRLHGPADFPMLRVSDYGDGQVAHSLRVGPNAYVQCFDHQNFHDSVFWFLPGETIVSVAGLKCSDRIDSIRLWDRPPFAHEPGYAAYMLWAASHVAKAVRAG